MVVGEGLLSAARFALRVVACGNALSLALESNLGRSFSSFPAWAEYLIADSLGSSGTFESDGGGGRIRTFEVDDGRFTVCSLWPLGNPTRGNSNFEVMLEMVVGEGLFVASLLTLRAVACGNVLSLSLESNLSRRRQIYSLLPLAAREPHHGVMLFTGLLPYREAGRIISNDAPL